MIFLVPVPPPAPVLIAARSSIVLKFAHALEYTLTRRGEVPAEPKPLCRLELTIYAVLLACFALALANTNPTLRNMVDAIV